MPRPGFGGKPYRGKGGNFQRGNRFQKGGNRQGGRRPDHRQAPSRELPLAGLGCEGVATGGELPPLPPAPIRHGAAGTDEEAALLGLDTFLVPRTVCAPWIGTIKTTEHDFHVREVARSNSNPDGEPVKLTSLASSDDSGLGSDAGRRDWREFTWEDFEDKAERDAAIAELKGLLAPGGAEAIVEFLKLDPKARDKRVSAILVCDKDGRRRVHQIFKDHIACLDSFTETKPRAEAGPPTAVYPADALDDSGNLRILVLKTRTKSLIRTRRWPKDQPPYLRFVMHKLGDDSSTAIARIARITHRTPKQFSLAGTKDRWAVTVQHVTAHHLWPDELAKVNEMMDSIRVGNCEFVDDQLSLGAHWGNEFGIVVRAVETADAASSSSSSSAAAAAAAASDPVSASTAAALSAIANVAPLHENTSSAAATAALTVAGSLSKWGESEYRFINYFGAQRFGTMAVRTHEVGVAILKGDFAAACCLILGYRPEEAAAHVAVHVAAEASKPTEAAAAAGSSAATALDGLFDATPPSSSSSASSSASPAAAAAAAAAPVGTAAPAPGTDQGAKPLSERESQARGLLELVRMRVLHPATAGFADRVLDRNWTPYNELAILTALMEKHRNNVVMGIVGIARNARLMYLHAAQSWLWNHAASERVRRHGMKPIAGDLIMLPEGEVPETPEEEPEDEVPEAAAAASASSSQGSRTHTPRRIPLVRVLTQADIEAGTAGIDDVVMPLPGTTNEYPRNDCGVELYRSLLARQGLEDSRLDALVEAFAAETARDPDAILCPDQGLWCARTAPMGQVALGDMTGGYRTLVTRARAAEWSVDWYDRTPGKPIPPAIKTDVEAIAEMTASAPAAATSSASASASAAASAPAAAELGTPWPCVVLRFRLAQGVYATMAMREAMKGDPIVATTAGSGRGGGRKTGGESGEKRARDGDYASGKRGRGSGGRGGRGGGGGGGGRA